MINIIIIIIIIIKLILYGFKSIILMSVCMYVCIVVLEDGSVEAVGDGFRVRDVGGVGFGFGNLGAFLPGFVEVGDVGGG